MIKIDVFFIQRRIVLSYIKIPIKKVEKFWKSGKLKIEVKAGKPHRKYPKMVFILDKDNLPFWLAVHEKRWR